MPIAAEHASNEKSAKLLIHLHLRTIYFRTFQCEIPCMYLYIITPKEDFEKFLILSILAIFASTKPSRNSGPCTSPPNYRLSKKLLLVRGKNEKSSKKKNNSMKKRKISSCLLLHTSFLWKFLVTMPCEICNYLLIASIQNVTRVLSGLESSDLLLKLIKA